MTLAWPDMPYEPWRATCSALHLYTRILGKYRLARSPWINHSWHATLYVTARGLTTSLVDDASGGIEIQLDLLDHAVLGAGQAVLAQDLRVKVQRAAGGAPGFIGNVRPGERHVALPFRK